MVVASLRCVSLSTERVYCLHTDSNLAMLFIVRRLPISSQTPAVPSFQYDHAAALFCTETTSFFWTHAGIPPSAIRPFGETHSVRLPSRRSRRAEGAYAGTVHTTPIPSTGCQRRREPRTALPGVAPSSTALPLRVAGLLSAAVFVARIIRTCTIALRKGSADHASLVSFAAFFILNKPFTAPLTTSVFDSAADWFHLLLSELFLHSLAILPKRVLGQSPPCANTWHGKRLQYRNLKKLRSGNIVLLQNELIHVMIW